MTDASLIDASDSGEAGNAGFCASLGATHALCEDFDEEATLLDSSWTSGPPTIDLGFTYVASETRAWQARYDDVVFDFQ